MNEVPWGWLEILPPVSDIILQTRILDGTLRLTVQAGRSFADDPETLPGPGSDYDTTDDEEGQEKEGNDSSVGSEEWWVWAERKTEFADQRAWHCPGSLGSFFSCLRSLVLIMAREPRLCGSSTCHLGQELTAGLLLSARLPLLASFALPAGLTLAAGLSLPAGV